MPRIYEYPFFETERIFLDAALPRKDWTKDFYTLLRFMRGNIGCFRSILCFMENGAPSLELRIRSGIAPQDTVVTLALAPVAFMSYGGVFHLAGFQWRDDYRSKHDGRRRHPKQVYGVYPKPKRIEMGNDDVVVFIDQLLLLSRNASAKILCDIDLVGFDEKTGRHFSIIAPGIHNGRYGLRIAFPATIIAGKPRFRSDWHWHDLPAPPQQVKSQSDTFFVDGLPSDLILQESSKEVGHAAC